MEHQDVRRDPGDDRCSEGGARELHVAPSRRSDHLRRALLGESRACRNRPNELPARRGHLGLGETVIRVTPRRPWRDRGASRVDRVVQVEGSHRDDEGVVRRPVGHPGLSAADSIVARRGDHDDAAEPELLDRLVERVPAEAARGRRMEREVRDPDVVLLLVPEDPLGGSDHVARARHSLVVHHVDRHDARRRRSARVPRCGPCRQTRDERSVAASVTCRVSGQGGHVHLRANPPGEVAPARLDAGVDEGDGRRVGAVPTEARERRPETIDTHGRRPELVGGVIRSLLAGWVLLLRFLARPAGQTVEDDGRVGNDHKPRGLGERRQVARSHLTGRGVDDLEPRAVDVVELVERVLRLARAAVALDDHAHVGVRRRGRGRLQHRREVAVSLVVPGARPGTRCQGSCQGEHEQREEPALYCRLAAL